MDIYFRFKTIISKDSSGRLIRFEFCFYCPWECYADILDYKFYKSLSPLGNHILKKTIAESIDSEESVTCHADKIILSKFKLR